MNRNEEWNRLTSETPNIPEELELSHIKKKVHRKAAVHYSLVSLRSIAVICVFLLAGFVVAVKKSPAFADEMRDVPILKAITNWASPTNGGKKAALESGYATEQKPVTEVPNAEGLRVTIPYAMADDAELYFHTQIEVKEEDAVNLSLTELYDTDTGEQIPVSSYYGCLIDFGESSRDYEWTVQWDGFHPNVRMVFSIEYTLEGAEKKITEAEYPIRIDRKVDSLVFDVNQTFSVNGFNYTVKKVTINPLSTNIELDLEDGAEPGMDHTPQLYFYLMDAEKKVRVGRAEEKGGLHYDYNTNQWISSIEAGLFTYNQATEYILGVDLIYQSTYDDRDMYWDLKDNRVYTEDGQWIPEIVITEEEAYYAFTLCDDYADDGMYHTIDGVYVKEEYRASNDFSVDNTGIPTYYVGKNAICPDADNHVGMSRDYATVVLDYRDNPDLTPIEFQLK